MGGLAARLGTFHGQPDKLDKNLSERIHIFIQDSAGLDSGHYYCFGAIAPPPTLS